MTGKSVGAASRISNRRLQRTCVGLPIVREKERKRTRERERERENFVDNQQVNEGR
jgi:hypothetical protein